MIPYCSATGTRTTREKFLNNGWRVLWVATGHNWASKPHLPYAIDNGAWSAHLRDKPFSEEAFIECLEFSRVHPELGTPDFTVLPDIVAGGLPSLDYSLSWEPRVRPYSKNVLIAVQDGMDPKDIEPYIDEHTGIFVGGSTPWKLRTLPIWGAVARGRCYLHVGRVNSVKRISFCSGVGAHSFDGTSACKFPSTFKLLNRARKQMALPLGS